MGDAHVVVVDDNGEHVGRTAVGPKQHQIVEILVRKTNLALNDVVDDRLAVERRLQPDHRLDPLGRFGRVAVAPAAVVTGRPLFGLGPRAHLLEFGLTGIAAVGLVLCEHLVDCRAVSVGALELRDRRLVGFKPHPRQPVDDRLDGRLGIARAVGVLDAQQHLAIVGAGEEPIEQGRARAADMKEARRRGGKAGHDALRHGFSDRREGFIGWECRRNRSSQDRNCVAAV